MKLYTLWSHEGCDYDETPWLVAACDEFSVETNDGYPEDYRKLKDGNPKLRELIIEIPQGAVIKLFQSPVVKGTVE